MDVALLWILFCHAWMFSLGVLIFSTEEMEGLDLWETEDEQELEGVEGEKTLIGIYCLRVERIFFSYFQLKGRNKKKKGRKDGRKEGRSVYEYY